MDHTAHRLYLHTVQIGQGTVVQRDRSQSQAFQLISLKFVI